jgi:cation diffusion facilitator family transporter
MRDLGVDEFDFEGNSNNNDESLHLKNYDSLDHHENIDSASKSFDMGSDLKLDIRNSDMLNKSSLQQVKEYMNGSKKHDKVKTGSTQLNSHHPHAHDHDHSHNHHHHISENLNVRAAAIHIIGDIIQSVGVLIAAIFIFACPEWQIIDPICTFMFSILVMFTTYFIVKDCMIILLEGVPNEISYRDVKMGIERIKGVISVKELHIWCLTSGKNCLAAKIVARVNTPVIIDIHELCKTRFKINKCFIEVNTI